MSETSIPWWKRPLPFWGLVLVCVAFGFLLLLRPPILCLLFLVKCVWDDRCERRKTS